MAVERAQKHDHGINQSPSFMHDEEFDDALMSGDNSRFGDFTKNDARDMQRMGIEQELRRNYRPLSAFSFTVILAGTWEFLLISNGQALIDGGPAGLFWSYIWSFFGVGIVMLSLAEMASMAPHSGGQYHWVAEFAPRRYHKFLSYLTGWMSTLSWQAGTTVGSYLTGGVVQGLVTISFPDYHVKNWHATLLIMGMVCIVFVFNIWGARVMPVIQNLLFIVHFFGSLIVVIVLTVLAPRNTARTVFTGFINGGEWPTMSLALQVGQLTAIYSLICADATAHIAEEIRDASRTVPITMVYSYVFNGLLGFVVLLPYVFAVTDPLGAVASKEGFPMIWVFDQALSPGGVIGIVVLILVLAIFSNVSFNAATARVIFAFARSKGLPFSAWVSHVCPAKQLPCRAILVTCVTTCLLGVINVVSPRLFIAILSLQIAALMFCYLISITCVCWRRLRLPGTLPTARWSLGRWGPLINVLSILYVAYAFFWTFWPSVNAINGLTFNWTIAAFGAVFIFAVIAYLLGGHKTYESPVLRIQRKRSMQKAGLGLFLAEGTPIDSAQHSC